MRRKVDMSAYGAERCKRHGAKHHMMQSISPRGFAIILVLATLVLLALLSLTYIKLALIDRNIARNYMDNVRAKLISQSGVDYAIGRLNNIIQQGWFKNGKFTDTSWIYNYSATNPPTPSFAHSQQIKINSEDRKLSMPFASSTYGQNSDIFSLKVIDTQSQININDGAKISNTHYTSLNLQRILNLLGMQLSPAVSTLGDRILEKRPPRGYSNKQELLTILGEQDYQRIKDFITVNSWTNDSVAVPVPLSNYSTVIDSYPFSSAIARPTDLATNQKIYRYGHNLNWEGIDISNYPGETDEFKKLIFADPAETSKIHGVYSTDALNPQWIELTQRSPLNINTASAEVLKALIVDLQGFFIMERRTLNPPVDSSNYYYSFLKPKYTFDKDNTWEQECFGKVTDELGFIYKTMPYYGTGGMSASGIDANKIAQEIVACRKRDASPNIAGLNYSLENFSGPFKSWAQFNIFVDELVEKGLIIDDRGYYDLKPTSSTFLNSTPTSLTYIDPPPVTQTTSSVQKRLASIAAGDVLKANFNPNLHLNELNPERQLYTMVDKTDLIVNSTEFCFTPMGTFETSSESYVLLPQGTNDSLTSSDNQIVARSKIETIVKLFDVYYETSQDSYYKGDFSDQARNINNANTTNNYYALETGPEVDNGKAITETEYDGYIRLSTNLGCLSTSKPKEALYTTYPDNATDPKYPGATAVPAGSLLEGYNANIHSHFQLDHVAHYHDLYSSDKNVVLPMGSIRSTETLPAGDQRRIPKDRYNFADKSEASLSKRSPYSPVDSPDPSNPRYRLCRSFRSNTNDPLGYFYAPSDLRSDGVYVEPHSAFGYDKVDFTNEAVVSFWLKANWFPELGGRIKTFSSMRKYMSAYTNDKDVEWPLPFDIIFWPREATYSSHGVWKLVLSAFYSNKSSVEELFTSVPHPAVGITTYSVSHEFETATENWDRLKGNCGNFNLFRNREWIHIIVRFCMKDTDETIGFTTIKAKNGNADIYVYNKISKYILFNTNHSNPPAAINFSEVLGPYIIIGGDFSSYCAINDLSGYGYCNRIFFADSTIDEFYFWAKNTPSDTTDDVEKAQDIWKLGRYYKPEDSTSADAVFTSQTVNLTLSNKSLQGESIINPPTAVGAGVPNIEVSNIEILGLAWTYYAEDYLTSTEADGTPRLKPVMWDWKGLSNTPETYTNLNTADARSLCEVRLRINNNDSATYDNDGYSAVNMGVNQSDIVKYKLKFKIGSAADLDTILLASPVFDDITIYYTTGVKFLSYSYFD